MTVEIMPGMIAVEVPEGAKDMQVISGVNSYLMFYVGRRILMLNHCKLPLPEGNWAYLFCTADASEEQAQLLIYLILEEAKGNYKNGYAMWEATAKESLQSLLKSKGLNNCAVLKKIN